MKHYYTFLFLFIGNHIVWGQDYLTTLKLNPLLGLSSRTELKPRGADTINIVPTWINPFLPFLDDFSTDRRRPKDLTPFLNSASNYFMTGKCVEYKNYKRGRYPFSKVPTRIYTFDPAAPPFYVDSTNFLPSISIAIIDDTPNCVVINSQNLFPATTRYKYNSTGVPIDSAPVFDTVLSVAQVFEVTLKNYLWIDRHAYFNSHIPYLPYGKGVATLDGLNEYGRPYDTLGFNTYGLADYLTSAPIDISGFSASDSLYLSFLYQPQGFGDWPDKQDSLVVEFKDNRGRWNQMKSIQGLRQAQPLDSLRFKHVLIALPSQIVPSDPFYFHDTFQFRFKNYATISGNNDHWHIDYVRLDSGRNFQDTIIKDLTFVYELPSVLKNYTLLPAKQYTGLNDLKDSFIGLNRNIIPSPIFNQYKYICFNENTGTIYNQNNSGLAFLGNPLVSLFLSPKNDLKYPSSIADSTYIVSKIFLDQSDIYTTNDTATNRQFFFNEMAYDDGSAEMAYGIQGLGTKKVAYRFFIPNKDTLAAIKIHFSNIDLPVSNLIFNINVWKTIGLNNKPETILKTISNAKPIYKDTLNGFITFGLDEPLEVQDTIYVGWTQTDERNLQIGYDRNSTLGIGNTFIMTNNVWSKTNVVEKGSPMIRLILDGKRNFRPRSSIEENHHSSSNRISIYPNPTAEYVNFEAEDYVEKELVIYDLLGKIVYKDRFRKELKVNVLDINSGFYIVQFFQDSQVIQTTKLQISK